MKVRLIYPCNDRYAPRLGDRLYPPGVNAESAFGYLAEVVGVRRARTQDGRQLVDVLLEYGDGEGNSLIMLGDEAAHGRDRGDPPEGPT